MDGHTGSGHLEELTHLHQEVDMAAEAVASGIQPPLKCGKGCSGCCLDDLTVFAVEADLIRQNHADLLSSGSAHPDGACAFLDPEGACRIYHSRPYVCRTQGLPLCWVEDDGSASLDICPLNLPEDGDGEAWLENLRTDQIWLVGEYEPRLAGLQLRAIGGRFVEELPRVALRDLFSGD